MGCVPSSQKNSHQNIGSGHYSDDNWLNRPQEGYHWEQNKGLNSTSKTYGQTANANEKESNEKDGTGVEGYVAAESYGGADGMGAAGCGAGGCGGCGGCGA